MISDESQTGRWIATLGVVALTGLAVLGTMLWRAVSIETQVSAQAHERFDSIRAEFPSALPLVRRDETGRFVRTDGSGRDISSPARRLRVVAYHASTHRLVSADIPIWFIRIKGPVAAYALRDTGFDLEILGLTASDLARSGAGLVIDESRGEDALLAWTE
jgi:hypothetical protein